MAPPRGVPRTPVPFKLRLVELRKAADLSQEDLAWETRKHGPGVSYNAIRKYEKGARVGSKAKGPRERSAEMRSIFEQLAGALGIEPDEFAEYRLLLAREALDEAVVGLETALVTLALVEGATSRASRAPASPAAAGPPKRLNQRRSRQEPGAPRKKSAGS